MDVNGELMPKEAAALEPAFEQDGIREKGREKTFWMLCKDKRYRGKLFHSFWLSCSLFSVWLVETQPSATFLDLQIITRTGFEEASAFFTIHTVGFMIGCVLCAILTKKVKARLLITFGLVAMGASTIATPYCSSYLLMMGIRLLSGIFPGLTESVIYAEQMRTWEDEGKSVTQLVMLLASGGFFLAPLISEPFLAAKPNQTTVEELDKNATYIVDFKPETTQFNLSYVDHSHPNFSAEISPIAAESTYLETDVQYAFFITGCFSILMSVLFFLSSCFHKGQLKHSTSVSGEKAVKYRVLPTSLTVGLMLALCLLVMAISSVGLTFAIFLMTFLVKEYENITKSESAYILALFYCCGSAIRIVLIFIADRISARNLFGFFIILVFISLVVFNIVAVTGETTALIVLVGIVNIALAPDMPLSLSWSQAEYMDVSSLISACITFSAALGVMVNPLLLAYLMEHRGNMWFCYLLTIEAFIAVVLLFVLFLFNHFYVTRRYGPLRVNELEVRKERCALSNKTL